ncbi:unannotated protein [freshwater metagenome]|uniref:Unannotated protein n=1 Tax=freshwater metagenome TaxID=449393 RepID=A0A6J7A603_9ZZZZ
MLLLVRVSALGDPDCSTEAIRPHAHALDSTRIRPLEQFRTHHTCVGSIYLRHQLTDGVGGKCDVVVQEAEEPLVPLDQTDDVVHGGAETRICRKVTQGGIGEHRPDPRRKPGVLAGQEEEHPQIRVVLGAECGERLVEPWSGVVCHHDCHNRR